jgi:hypothetical protein
MTDRCVAVFGPLPPMSEAGVALVKPDETSNFGRALVRALADRSFRMLLAELSRQAYLQYFPREVIALRFRRRYAQALILRNPVFSRAGPLC